MDKLQSLFEQYDQLMDQEIIGVQLGCYSVAMIGLAAAIRKVRPFSRFKNPKDIPNQFIKERRTLTGYVQRIDPNGGILMVEHKPLISLPIVPKGELPVKVLGVKPSGLGLNWLQSIVVDSQITFIPVKKDTKFVHCEVWLPNTKNTVTKTSDQKKGVILRKLFRKNEEPSRNVAECLVRIGFAEVVPLETPIVTNSDFKHYYESLQLAQKYATKKKLGMKYYINNAQNLINVMLMKSFLYSKQLWTKVLVNIQNVPAKPMST